ncbi:MAG: hypothetical protein U1F05_10890 [Burkholderiales bacterium]
MRFEPWIGEKYLSEGLSGVRVLALGESHYAEPEFASPTFTTEVVRECVYEGRVAYFTKVAKLLRGMGAGVYMPNDVLRDTWDRIAFYNYVQQMLPAPRVRPTEAMWKEAQEIFPSVIGQLQPQLIVVMGKHLREWFVPPQGIEACFTEHPSSSRFSYEPWSTNIQSAYSQVLANNSFKPTPLRGAA